MHKLMGCFHRPTEVDRLEQQWGQAPLPLAGQGPGIRRIAVSRVQDVLGTATDVRFLQEF